VVSPVVRDLVVIGGGVALGAWDLIGEGLERELAARARISFVDVRVRRAQLGADAGLIGAAALVYRPGIAAGGSALDRASSQSAYVLVDEERIDERDRD
jgi:hypothetical protein